MNIKSVIIASIFFVSSACCSSVEIPEPTPEQSIWLEEQSGRFACAWKGKLSEFDASKSKQKALRKNALPVTPGRNCERVEEIAKKQKNKAKLKRLKKIQTNPFALDYTTGKVPAAEQHGNTLAEKYSVYMADSSKKESIKIRDITSEWLWKRFFAHRSASYEKDEEKKYSLISRESLQFYAGAGISVAGFATMGFDSAVVLASKIGVIQCACGAAPSLLVALLLVRTCYHALVNWATKDVIVSMDNGLQELKKTSDERRLKDHVHLVFSSLYQAKVTNILQRELDNKHDDESLRLIHERIIAWTATNTSNQDGLVELQSDMKKYVSLLQPETLVYNVMQCDSPAKKPSVGKTKKIATIYDTPDPLGTSDADDISYSDDDSDNDIVSYSLISSILEVPVDKQLCWCTTCNNAGKKSCANCKGFRLVKVRLKNGCEDWCQMPNEQAT